MNFNTLSPTAKMLKKLGNYSTGQPVASNDVPNIAIINACDILEGKKLVENLVCGIKSQGASAFVHNAPYFGFCNKINPLTAKYAESFRRVSAATADAIIKSNMADGVVIVADCDITTAGLLHGCLTANCPALVLPLGAVAPYDTALKIMGKVTRGELTTSQSEDVLRNEYLPKSQSTYFTLLENIGLCAAGASTNKRASGAQLLCALQTGEKVVQYAKSILSPKKFLTKNTYTQVVELTLAGKAKLDALDLIYKLFNANDIKTPHEYLGERAVKTVPTPRIVRTSGSACGGGGYVQYLDTTPPSFSGKAWVYQSLEDADRALLGGSLPSGAVMVLLNCVDTNVTALAHAIIGMGREKEIAIVTDGTCDNTGVLAVSLCRPDSLANEEFANIQNGDALEIDVAKGRFNTSILSKDQKARAKRNTTKKQVIYF